MLLNTLLAAAVLHALPQPAPAPQNTSAATAEGTEILRRILVESLNGAFEDPKRSDQITMRKRGMQMHSLVTTLWVGDQTVQHSRAFHLPDAGLFFALDVALPVVAKDKAPEPVESDQPTDDEWERYRREVRGHASADGALFPRLTLEAPRATEIDPAATEKVIDAVLATVARHASRVEGLNARETITVALRLSGRHRTLLHGLDPLSDGLEYEFGREPAEEEGTEPGEGDSKTFSAFVIGTGYETREQNLVIRLTVGDLAGAAEGGLERLRQRAQVNLY